MNSPEQVISCREYAEVAARNVYPSRRDDSLRQLLVRLPETDLLKNYTPDGYRREDRPCKGIKNA